MEIIHGDDELQTYLEKSVGVNSRQPVLIDKYLTGIEVEIVQISEVKQRLFQGLWNILNGWRPFR